MIDNVQTEPLVSVVMSVFNGADQLDVTLDSILAQQDCFFEVVVVDDGSTDSTPEVLANYAERDERIRVFRQSNTGLTGALIFGCGKARGTFIARQDADDLSLPGRFQEQSAYLLSHPDVVIVASGVRFVAPQGEWLFDNLAAPRVEIELDVDRIRTPSLVGTMFRRDAYLGCGGFRKRFLVAQDVDLWLRLEETGRCHGIPAVHYEARMTPGGISSRRRGEQFEMGSLAIECAKLRRRGEDENLLLDAFVPTVYPPSPMTRHQRARFNYFIASCLRKHDRAGARRYYELTIRDNPFHLKALLRCIAG